MTEQEGRSGDGDGARRIEADPEAAGVPDILRRIVAARRLRYPAAPGGPPSSPLSGGFSQPGEMVQPFLAALRAGGPRAVIAEVKLGSPRLGSLAGRVDAEGLVTIYERAGAAALSVVVEPDFFFGSWELLTRAKAACGLPAIAKDFIVSEHQLDEAVAAGADAILLIATLYSSAELCAWATAAGARGLEVLVETHSESDLEVLGGGQWPMVGVNNRNLRTFEVDLERSIRMAQSLPRGALRVAESGIASRADIERLGAAGFEAFLIGERLLLAEDPAAGLADLLG